MANYAYVNSATGIVENTIVLDEGSDWQPEDGYIVAPYEGAVSIGWSYADGVFTPPPEPPLSDEEITAGNIAELQARTDQATYQKSALAERVGTLTDAVELELATPEEAAELPVRKTQLTAWKTYAIYLGRVTQQEDWALTVTWPDAPTAGIGL